MEQKREGDFRKGIFFVVYHLEDRNPKFLIQKRKLHWKGYEFPKGGIESGEFEEECVKREIFEETGLNIKKLKNHHLSGKYLYRKALKDRPNVIGQTWKLYSAEVGKGNVEIDPKEHSSYEWLNYEDARKKLTWNNQKNCLDIVWDWINRKSLK